jgi:hypothetical protein
MIAAYEYNIKTLIENTKELNEVTSCIKLELSW